MVGRRGSRHVQVHSHPPPCGTRLADHFHGLWYIYRYIVAIFEKREPGEGAARSSRLGASAGGGLVQRDLHREGGLLAVGARGWVAHAGEVPDDWLGGGREGELGEEEAEDDLCGVRCVVGVVVEVDGCGERGESEVKCGGVSVTR